MSRLGFEEAVLADPQGAAAYAERARRMQAFSDLICSRLDWLEGRDRILLEMVYDRGFSYRTVARITRMRPSSVSRRIRILANRLLSREYQICLLHRNDLSCLQMSIAREHFVLGMGRRAIARRHHISLYCLGHHLNHLAALSGIPTKILKENGPGQLREGA